MIGQAGRAAEVTGLIPDDILSQTVGQELRRMIEVTGEVSQSDLLELAQIETPTPELEERITTAVAWVREAG